jgi:hypothetical protein
MGRTLEKIARRSSWKICSWYHQSDENVGSLSIVTAESFEVAVIEFVFFSICFSLFIPCLASQMRKSGNGLVINLSNEKAYIIRRMVVMTRGEDGR